MPDYGGPWVTEILLVMFFSGGGLFIGFLHADKPSIGAIIGAIIAPIVMVFIKKKGKEKG